MLCEDLEGWDREGGREAQEGGDMGVYVCTWLIHFGVQQKLPQYCEAIKMYEKKRNFLTSSNRCRVLHLPASNSHCCIQKSVLPHPH